MNWEVREYQQEAIAECVAAFESGKRSVMLESPVGAGKTYVLAAAAMELRRLGISRRTLHRKLNEWRSA